MLKTVRIPHKPLRLARTVITNAHLLPSTMFVDYGVFDTDTWTNVNAHISELALKKFHKNEEHPIGIVRSSIEKILGEDYVHYNDFKAHVKTRRNFDDLGIPSDHPSRSRNDTYYINEKTVLRTHTSAHEIECLRRNESSAFLISADVYRRDTIDRTHFSVFHQMEGVKKWDRLPNDEHIEQIKKEIAAIPDSGLIIEDEDGPFSETNPKQPELTDLETQLVSQHLKKTIELVMGRIFEQAKQACIEAGVDDPDLLQPIKARWNEDEFSWTQPSYEIEIFWRGEWLEMCGCGVLKKGMLERGHQMNSIGWAFGIGLDRTAMVLFGIDDIRLFWSEDERFTKQFSRNKITMFKPYSKHPSTSRDVAFWAPSDARGAVHINEVSDIAREFGEGLVEKIELIDMFPHPRTAEISHCYRITYQSMDRNLTNEEVNEIQSRITFQLALKLHVDIR